MLMLICILFFDVDCDLDFGGWNNHLIWAVIAILTYISMLGVDSNLDVKLDSDSALAQILSLALARIPSVTVA